MEIPQNNSKDEKLEKVVNEVLSALASNGTYHSYSASNGIPYTLAKKVCQMFSEKGYHAHISHFVDGRASYQAMAISKSHLGDSCGRMIYYEDF